MGKTLYILKSRKSGRYYVGSGNDLNLRIKEHNSGQTKSTRSGIPWDIVYRHDFNESIDGHRAEMKIKSMKSRKIIEKLFHQSLDISDLFPPVT